MKISFALFLALSLAPGAMASAKTIEISAGRHKKKARPAAADEDSGGDEGGKKKDDKKKPSYKTVEPAAFQPCMSSPGAPAKLDAYVMLSLDESGRVINVELAGDDPNLEKTPVGACIIDVAKKQSGLDPGDSRPTVHVVLTKN